MTQTDQEFAGSERFFRSLLVVYRAFQWAVRKAKERAAEERFIAGLAAEMKLDREGDGDWLRG